MEIDIILDQDFLFYLGFIGIAMDRFKTNPSYAICQAWLDKLCGELWLGTAAKRNRNIFLSQLVLCMEDGRLTEPFHELPPPGELPNANKLFGQPGTEIKEPTWMADMMQGAGDDDPSNTIQAGRTYLATKALPDGKGALGYIAVSLEDDMSEWAKGEGLDVHFERKFGQMVPPMTQMERILINRRNPEERQRILSFYENLASNVAKEIHGTVPLGSNSQVTAVIDQLIRKLQQKGEFRKYEQMHDDKRRLELLYLLDQLLNQRIHHVKTREFFLDDIENTTMQPSFWERSMQTEDFYKEDKRAYAVKMWEQAITAGPKKKLMDSISEKFLELLANVKEKIAIRIQRRHENIVSQLKKELRKEGEKGKKGFDDAKYACDEFVSILSAIKAADKRAYESQQKRTEHLYGHRKERDEMYEQVRRAMMESQQHVEEEAALGKFLTDQINTLSEQSAIYQHVNEESILKTEEENIALMNDIQRLKKAVRRHENRISTMKQLLKKETNLDKGSEFFHF